MKQCYSIFPKENTGWDITATASKGIDSTKELYSMVDKNNTLLFNLTLKKIRTTKKGIEFSDDISQFNDPWLDMLINDFAIPLFSKTIKNYFDENIKSNNYLRWINIKISGNNCTKIYYVPEFIKKLDVLNIEKCTLNEEDGRIIVPCFSYAKVQKYVLFQEFDGEEYLWRVPSSVTISDETRRKLIENKFTGIMYEKIRTSE
jgi:hypothetical protein